MNDIRDLINALESKLGACEKCGCGYGLVTVYEDNKSNNLVGFKLLCGCNVKDDVITQDELIGLKTYSSEFQRKSMKFILFLLQPITTF